MSDVDPLDLSNLQLIPDWVKQPQEKPKFKEESVRPERGGKGGGGGRGFGGGGGGRGGDRRGGGGPPQGRRDDNRRGGGGGGGGQGRGRGDNQNSGKGRGRDNRRGGGGGGGQRQGQRRDNDRPRPDPLPKDVTLFFQPAREGVAFIAQQIKTSGCAYPVFDLARLILNNRDRYGIVFESKGDTKLFLCKLDDSLWLSRDEAAAHATHAKEFGDYYREDQVTVDPPKGNFSSIAVCGLSGKLLGPPNHHSYQENIVRVHAERFSRMHIDGYKRKIKIERDEEIVEKWKEQESTQTHFTVLKAEEGAEPVILKSRQEAIRHFSQHFASDLIREVKKATLPGDITGTNLARPLFNLLRQEGERVRKFPMDIVQRLCRAFEKQGLKFFKEGKKTTYVARLRPRTIANEEKFSDGIRKIVEYVRAHPNTKLNDLAGALIPESKRSAAPPKAKKPKKRRSGRRKPRGRRWPKGAFTIWARRSPRQPAPEQKPEQDKTVPRTAAFTIWARPKPVQKADAKPAPPALTPEEVAVLQDLRWLIREGYIIEFSNGTLKLPRTHEQPKKKAAKKKAVATPTKTEVKKPDNTPTAPPPSTAPAVIPQRDPDPTPVSPPPSA